MMPKRQMIILCGVVVAAGVFIYDRMLPSMKKNRDIAVKSIEESEIFASVQEQLLQATELKPHETMMLDMLLEESPANPFARQWSGMISDQKRINRLSTIEPILSYNGFIRSGERFVALVNDEDYEVGNKIDHVPLTIRKITPNQIGVENPDTISQTRLSVKIIPLKDENDE